jgi:uroporphyrin-III C-methyltransferase
MRGYADQFCVVTAVGQQNSSPEMPPFSPTRTLVILMSVSRLKEIVVELLDIGYPGELPAAIVERGSQTSQRTFHGTLASIALIADTNCIRAPASIVLGNVVRALNDSSGPTL